MHHPPLEKLPARAVHFASIPLSQDGGNRLFNRTPPFDGRWVSTGLILAYPVEYCKEKFSNPNQGRKRFMGVKKCLQFSARCAIIYMKRDTD